jgi:glycosyltransferase involved in cell wall biosynthesis
MGPAETPLNVGAPAITPGTSPQVDATVLICTYNRAEYLARTLDSLSSMPAKPGFSWDVLVADNNSSDDTRDVVASRMARFPVPLRYLFEGRQGKSNALNTGMSAAQAEVIVFTDDDVEVGRDWIATAVRPLLQRRDVDYTGGPVRPIWGAPRPAWLEERGNLGGTIAVMDHGDRAFIFEDERKVALGVNMAVRRSLIERVGGFRPDLGRNGKALLGQEQAEFFYRTRRAGARGLYVPDMVLDHVVPAARLTRTYYRKWWYWKGVSHARVHGIHGRTELGIDTRSVPRVLGVPRFIFGSIVRNVWGWLGGLTGRNPARRAEHWLSLVYYAGYCREIWFPTTLGREAAVQTPGRRPSSESPALS